MLIDLTKTAAKSAGIFFLEHVKFTLPGLLLSLGLGIWALSFLSGRSGSTGGHAGGFGAILVLFSDPALLAWLVLTIGFAVLYGTYSHKRAITRVICFITQNKSEAMADYVVEKFMGFVQKRKPDLLVNTVNKQQAWLELFDNFLADKTVLPGFMRRLVRHYSRKADLARIIGVEIDSGAKTGAVTSQQISAAVSRQLKDKLDELSSPSSVWGFWLLVGAQIIYVFVMRHWLVP